MNQYIKEERYILGIDMGTTSIKVTIISSISFSVIEEHTDSSNMFIINNGIQSEQNVSKIIQNLNNCMSLISENILRKVIGIGICGQVHGLICWSSNDNPLIRKTLDNKHFFEVNPKKVSHHYTWQDNRCNKEFLSSLPKPDSHLTIHSGYGCCTLFWLSRNSPVTIESFNRAGTIADFVVSMLCDLDTVKMSTQSAASWGYYNTERNEWNINLLKNAKFPVHFLPEVTQPNVVAKNLKYSWHNIPIGVPVGVALGDLQCSVFAALDNDDHAVVNISTSAQLIFVLKNFSFTEAEKTVAKFVPYFDGKYLSETAALNGDELWKILIENGYKEENQSDLLFEPTFLGERHKPDQRGSIVNIHINNFKLFQIFRALCKGVVTNLHSMTSSETLNKKQIKKIIGIGSALLRNKILQMELEKQYSLPVEYKRSGDAPFGAALSMLQTLNFHKLEI
ncbi:hypothetical protein PGB90_007708 [Kerria lacca]